MSPVIAAIGCFSAYFFVFLGRRNFALDSLASTRAHGMNDGVESIVSKCGSARR